MHRFKLFLAIMFAVVIVQLYGGQTIVHKMSVSTQQVKDRNELRNKLDFETVNLENLYTKQDRQIKQQQILQLLEKYKINYSHRSIADSFLITNLESMYKEEFDSNIV